MALSDLKHLNGPGTDWVNEGGIWPSLGSILGSALTLVPLCPAAKGCLMTHPFQAQ